MKRAINISIGIFTTALFAFFVTQHLESGAAKSHFPNDITANDSDDIKEGDIIFQSSKSGQSLAVQLATRSKYSHCGVILKKDNELYVYEAVQPVKYTPFEKWVTHGDGSHYTIKRLKNAEEVLTTAAIERMKQNGEGFKGKNYDIYFEWSDDKIYCSELVWKLYKNATGIEIGKLQKLKEFDLTHKEVKRIMNERYGNKIPYEETVISPVSIFESELLETVLEK